VPKSKDTVYSLNHKNEASKILKGISNVKYFFVNIQDYFQRNYPLYTWVIISSGYLNETVFWCCRGSSSEHKSDLESAVFPQKRAVPNRATTLILLRNDAVIYFTHTHRQRGFSVYCTTKCDFLRTSKCTFRMVGWLSSGFNVQSSIINGIKHHEIYIESYWIPTVYREQCKGVLISP
jgi:hypothetical protein